MEEKEKQERDRQAAGPEWYPDERARLQQPDEGDPEDRELGHLRGQTGEAHVGVFESGAPSMIDGHRPGMADLDAGATQGPGGDSRPDLRDPSTAQFTRVDGDQASTTTREELPDVERGLAEEMASHRSDDDLAVSARPMGIDHDQEGAVLEHSPVRQKEPKEPMDR